jgi:glucans biosynthesis protein C
MEPNRVEIVKYNMTTTTSPARRYDLDWLRVLAVLLLVPFHAALIFVLYPGSIMYVKDSVNSEFLDRMAGVIHQFHMPLLFLISGSATYLALGYRSAGQYLRERVLRLLVPFIFAMLALLPPMTYLTRLARGENITFAAHYLGFFRINPNDLNGYYGYWTPAHTWFIAFLFVYSALLLPLFLWLRTERGQRLTVRLAAFFGKRLALLLLIIPLALAASTGFLGAQNPIYYLLVFLSGYWIMTDDRYRQVIGSDAVIYLALGVICEVIRQTWWVEYAEWSPLWVLRGVNEQATRLLLTLAVLGIGQRLLQTNTRSLRYLSEIAFPFYILHLPLTTLAGYYLIRLDAVIAVKYILIVAVSTLLTLAGSELVRRIAILRFLFGMKTKSGAMRSKGVTAL